MVCCGIGMIGIKKVDATETSMVVVLLLELKMLHI